MQYWKREYRLRFPDLGLEYNNNDDEKNALDISFDIDKDVTQESNKSKLTIINLAEESIRKIEKADTKVEIYAGYKDLGGAVHMFSGTVIESNAKDNGKEVTLELTLSDGQVALRDTQVSLSFPPGTDAESVVKALANEMGLPTVYGEGVKFQSFPDGYSCVGAAKDAMTEVCEANQLTWSIQNGIITIILDGGITQNRGLVFSAATGLIGSPERIIRARPKEDKSTDKRKRKQKEKKEKPDKKAGWKIKVLLSPAINAGDAVKVESRIISGWFRAESVKHHGDLSGGDWVTEIELIEGLENNG